MYTYVYNVWHIQCVMMEHSILDRIVHVKIIYVSVERVKHCSIFKLSRTTIFCSIYLFFQKFYFNWQFFILMKNVHMATLNIYIHSFLKFFHTRTNIMLLGCFYSPPNKQNSNKQKSNKQHYYILNQYLLYKTKKHTTTYNNNKL